MRKRHFGIFPLSETFVIPGHLDMGEVRPPGKGRGSLVNQSLPFNERRK